jgi:hypothetical protein
MGERDPLEAKAGRTTKLTTQHRLLGLLAYTAAYFKADNSRGTCMRQQRRLCYAHCV